MQCATASNQLNGFRNYATPVISLDLRKIHSVNLEGHPAFGGFMFYIAIERTDRKTWIEVLDHNQPFGIIYQLNNPPRTRAANILGANEKTINTLKPPSDDGNVNDKLPSSK